MTYRKFAPYSSVTEEQALQTHLAKALTAYDNGDIKPLKEMHLCKDSPVSHLGGWEFDLAPYLKLYWVDIKYYGICKVWAMNKTDIRKFYGSHSVLKIVEV